MVLDKVLDQNVSSILTRYTLFRDDHARYGFRYAGSRREESNAHYRVRYFECVAWKKARYVCVCVCVCIVYEILLIHMYT